MNSSLTRTEHSAPGSTPGSAPLMAAERSPGLPGEWTRNAQDYERLGLSAEEAAALLARVREIHASMKRWKVRAAGARLASTTLDKTQQLEFIEELSRGAGVERELLRAEILRELRRDPELADEFRRTFIARATLAHQQILQLASGTADLIENDPSKLMQIAGVNGTGFSALRAAIALSLLEGSPCLSNVIIGAWGTHSSFLYHHGPRAGQPDPSQRTAMLDELIILDRALSRADMVSTCATDYWLRTAPPELLPADETTLRYTSQLQAPSLNLLPVHLRGRAETGRLPTRLANILTARGHPLATRLGLNEVGQIIEHRGLGGALDPAALWADLMRQVHWLLDKAARGPASQAPELFAARLQARKSALEARQEALSERSETLCMNQAVVHVLRELDWGPSGLKSNKVLTEEAQAWYLGELSRLAAWTGTQAQTWSAGWAQTQQHIAEEGLSYDPLGQFRFAASEAQAGNANAIDWMQLRGAWNLLNGVTLWSSARIYRAEAPSLIATARWNATCEEASAQVLAAAAAASGRSHPTLPPRAQPSPWDSACVARALRAAGAL